jgi:hypothetical protein
MRIVLLVYNRARETGRNADIQLFCLLPEFTMQQSLESSAESGRNQHLAARTLTSPLIPNN